MHLGGWVGRLVGIISYRAQSFQYFVNGNKIVRCIFQFICLGMRLYVRLNVCKRYVAECVSDCRVVCDGTLVGR